MIFAGIDVNIITHEKALAAGVEAFGLWCWGMCYSQLHATNGRLPRVAVLSAFGEQARYLRRAAVRLCTAGLWIECEDGSFIVHNYGKKNQTAEDIRRRKDQAAERVRRWREGRRNADVTQNVTQAERVRTDLQLQTDNTTTTTTTQERESAPRNVTQGVTLSPPSIDLDESIKAWAVMAGAPVPTEDHVAEFLLDAAKHGKVFADSVAAFKSWMLKQKRIDSDRRERVHRGNGSKNLVQSAEGRAWTPPKEMP